MNKIADMQSKISVIPVECRLKQKRSRVAARKCRKSCSISKHAGKNVGEKKLNHVSQ